jgi:hypothetical protein
MPTDLEPAPAAGHLTKSERRSERALEVLPPAFRRVAGYFWAMNSHLLPTPTPLALRVAVWVRDEGLTADEFRAVVHALSRPARQANHRFAADLLADLAAEADAVVKRRRRDDRSAAERAEAERHAATCLPPDEVRDALRANPFLSQFLPETPK